VVVRYAVTGPDSSRIFKLLAHRSTIPQINMIPHTVILNCHWANQPCSIPLMVNANQGRNRCPFFCLWLDLIGVRIPDLPHSGRTLYLLGNRSSHSAECLLLKNMVLNLQSIKAKTKLQSMRSVMFYQIKPVVLCLYIF